MDENTADSFVLKILELLLDLGRCDPVVPHPERYAPELRRRILKRLQDFRIRILNLLLLASGDNSQENQNT